MHEYNFITGFLHKYGRYKIMERKATNLEMNWEIFAMLPLKSQINLEAFLEFNDIRAVDNSETAGRVWLLPYSREYCPRETGHKNWKIVVNPDGYFGCVRA
jgi:hypothetical protein